MAVEEKTTSKPGLRRMAAALALAVVVMAVAGAQGPTPDKAAPALRARELMAASRAALGGEAVLSQVRSFSASGKLRRFIRYVSVKSPTKVEEKSKTLPGKIEVDFLLPDRFRRQVSGVNLRGFGYSYVEVINGDRAWRKPPLPVRSAQGDGRVIDVGDFERSLALQAHNARQQMTFYTLGWLLQSLPSFPLELSYAGEYETEGRVADVIVAQGPDESRLVLLLDQKTHLPLALVFSFVEARRATILVEAASVSRKFIQDTFLRARQERQARAKPPARVEVQWRFSDHRPVEGLLLPHRITTAFNGELNEELVITEFALNRSFNPKKFEGQPAEKY